MSNYIVTCLKFLPLFASSQTTPLQAGIGFQKIFFGSCLQCINTCMTEFERRQKLAVLQWMLQLGEGYTHAVTLTLKPYRSILTERGLIRESLTHYSAQSNMRHFINRLNASVYGNTAKRYGRSITLQPMLEGEATNKLLHYHCAVGNFPQTLSQDAITKKIESAWHQTAFGNKQVHVRPIYSNGWQHYINEDVGYKNADVLDSVNLR